MAKNNSNQSQEQENKLPELNETGLMIGNKDAEGTHPFNPTWDGAVVVRQSEVKKIGDGVGDYAEVPSSVKLMPYEPRVFEALENNGGLKGYKIVILHDPR